MERSPYDPDAVDAFSVHIRETKPRSEIFAAVGMHLKKHIVDVNFWCKLQKLQVFQEKEM